MHPDPSTSNQPHPETQSKQQLTPPRARAHKKPSYQQQQQQQRPAAPADKTKLTGDGREESEEDGGVVPGGQEAEALLQKHEPDEQHDGADRGLVDDAPDEGDQAEPRQEQVDQAVDEAVFFFFFVRGLTAWSPVVYRPGEESVRLQRSV